MPERSEYAHGTPSWADVQTNDPVKAKAFYGSLFESEARHHTTYVRMATYFADEATVRARLQELATDEATIISAGDPLPRMHS